MSKAVLIGRFCPVHLGHERVIGAMIQRFGSDNCLVGIGSCNHPVSLRHFFSYTERRDFLLKLFPALKVFGLPDFGDDKEWMLALDDMLRLCDAHPAAVTFFGGCDEEVRFYHDAGRRVEILNRFDGTTPKISATEVRDALIHNREVEQLLNPLIADEVRRCFEKRWEAFKKM